MEVDSLEALVCFATAIALIAVSALVARWRRRSRDLRERQGRLLALAETERLSRLDPDGPAAQALQQALEARVQGWAQERRRQREGAVRQSLLLLVAGVLTLVAAIGLVTHGVERFLVLYG